MPDASVTLGLNADEFDRALAAASSKMQSAGGTFESSLGGAGKASDGLLESSHRTARAIHSFAGSMASGADASQLLAGGIEGLQHVLNVPLGALAGLAVGAVLTQQLFKAYEEAEETKNKIHELTLAASTNADFSTLTELETRLKTIHEQTVALSHPGLWAWVSEATLNPGGWKAYKKELDDMRAALKTAAGNESAGISGKIQMESGIAALSTTDPYHGARAKLESDRLEALGAMAGQGLSPEDSHAAGVAINAKFDAEKEALDRKHFAEQRSLELEEKILSIRKQGGNVELKTAEAKIKAAEKALQMAVGEEEIKKAQLKLETENLDKKRLLDSRGDATKFTLSELAARGDDYGSQVVRGKYIGADIAKARDAEREKGLAEDALFAGKDIDANLHMQRYQSLTQGIGSLKSTEKDPFKSALGETEKKLEAIEKNTAKPFVNH